MVTLLTDDFTGANGAAWDTNKWTLSQFNTGNCIADIQGNEGRMLINSTASANYFVRQTAVMPDTGDQEMLVKVRVAANGTGSRLLLFLNASGLTNSEIMTQANSSTVAVVYTMITLNTSSQSIWVNATGIGETAINGSATVSTTWGTTHRWVRFRTFEGRAQLKWWADGSAEPAGWYIDHDISANNIPAGKAGLSRETSATTGATGDARVDDFSISDFTPDIVNQDIQLADTPNVSLQATDAEALLPLSIAVDLDTPTATVQANDVEVNAQTIVNTTITATEDYYGRAGNYNGQFNPILDDGNALLSTDGGHVLIKVGKPTKYTDASKVSATLNIFTQPSGGGTTTVRVHAITAPWDSTTTWGNHQTSAEYVDQTISNAEGAKAVDVTSLVGDAAFYGFAIYVASSTGYGQYLYTLESANPAHHPSVTYSFESLPESEIIDLDTPTASLTANDVIVEIYDPISVAVDVDTAMVSVFATDAEVSAGVSIDVDAATISLEAYDAEVETVISPDVTLDVSTPVIISYAYDPTIVIPVAVDVDSAALTVTSHEAEVEVKYNAVVDVDLPSVRLKATRPESVNNEPIPTNEADDPYFESTMLTMNGSRGETGYWFRLNETGGDKAYNRISGGHPGNPLDYSTYRNVGLGRTDAPEGRHSVYFNGTAWISQWEASVFGTNGSGDERYSNPTSLEFTFRTTRATQFIMGGQDVYSSHNFPETPQSAPYEIWMVDGQLEIRLMSMGFTNEVVQRLTVPGVLNDGEWHHIVHQKTSGGSNEPGTPSYFSAEVYVDGDLAIRRRIGTAPAGMPDYIGGRPNGYEFGTTVGDLATSHWFLGDMTEVIFRNGRALSEDEVHRQRDAIFAIEAIRPDTARVNLDAYDPVVKGNKPRVLILDFGQTHMGPLGSEFTVSGQAKATADLHYLSTYDDAGVNVHKGPGMFSTDFPGWGERGMWGVNGDLDSSYPDYLGFYHSVFGPNASTTYRDEVTDNLRLIDLEKDLNMDDFDVISIVGYPRTQRGWLVYQQLDDANAHPMTPAKRQLELLMGQIRDQVINNRMSVMITDPFSAIALGIIDKAEYVPNFKEQAWFDARLGAQGGDFDWHSAVIDPFNGASPEVWDAKQIDFRDPRKFTSNLKAAARYEDTHANLRQRLRYAVEGLTDTPGWIQTDEIKWWNLNPMGNPPYHLSRAYEHKPFGLTMNQEFYMEGGRGETFIKDPWAWILERLHGWVATPMANVKVGHAVTTFAQQFHSLTVEHPDEISGDNVNFDTVIGNPYGDHAVSIAVVPGDLWNGQYVTGKVYVNFTEARTWQAHWPRYDYIMALTSRGFDPRESIGYGDVFRFPDGGTWTVNEFHLKYQFSTHYGSHQGSEVQLPDTGSGSDWGWSPGGVRGSAGLGGLGAGEAMQWRWRSSVRMERIYVPTMANRAVKWLVKDADIAGNANIAVGSASVTAKANDVVVETQRNVEVDVSAARFTVEAYNDQDTPTPDAVVLVGTPSVSLNAPGLTMQINVDSPTVTFRASDPAPEAYEVDWSEAVVMTLPRSIETLILEDNS